MLSDKPSTLNRPQRIYRRKREALLKTFDHIVMEHRLRLYQLLQQPATERTPFQLDGILDDLTRQLTTDIPSRLEYLTEP